MKRKNNGTISAQYDFSKGIRGKYAARYAKGTNIVVLEPDVAKVFSDSKLVNETLRAVAKIARQPSVGRGNRSKKKSTAVM